MIDQRVDLILLLHSMIMSFGGIPLLYYGDEIGMLNDFSYMDDEAKAHVITSYSIHYTKLYERR